MYPNMERDVRKGHCAKICEDSPQIVLVKQRKWLKNVWFLDAATLEIKRKESACIKDSFFQCFVLWNGVLFLGHS